MKQLIATIQARFDRDVEILNKQSSELDHTSRKLKFFEGTLVEAKARCESAEGEYRDLLMTYRARQARVEAIRDLLKDFEKNGDE